MKITVSGLVGSGKSTVSKLLAEKLGYEYYSVGRFMRDIAKDKDMTIMQLTKIAETDKTIDKELDKRQIDIGKSKKDFIMDSRLGFNFIPDSIKIFLKVDLKEAARRIHTEVRDEETYTNLEDAMKQLKKRMDSEKIRYKEYYGIDFPKEDYFDIIIDTTKKYPEEIVKILLEKIENFTK